ncbi:hypothetical protein QL285_058758 [Trifolium repens]|nr:hypothetical protein QL285_058758 [Trifolium repens]
MAAEEVWKNTELWSLVHNLILNATEFVPMVFEMTLWWRRNKNCWNEKLPTIFEVIRRSQETLQDWQLAQQKRSRGRGVSIATMIHKWLKPTPGSFKCNVDTTCYVEDNNYCVGGCIRDHNGLLWKPLRINLRAHRALQKQKQWEY